MDSIENICPGLFGNSTLATMKPASPVTVRQANKEDLPLILDFIRKKAVFDQALHRLEATEERLFEALFGPRPQAFVIFAEVDQKAIGFAFCFLTFSSFLARSGIWLDDLFVDEEYRGLGAGTAMLGYLAGVAEERGYGRIEWVAGIANEKGLDFYRRNGAELRERSRVLRLDREGISKLAGAGAG